jgi:hypothetical protein
MSALLELGTYEPLRAVLGFNKKSELSLSATLLDHLSASTLLILDLLYGQVPRLAQLQAKCWAMDEQHILLRVGMKLGVKIINQLEDTSATVEVALRDKAKLSRVLKTVRLREVRGLVEALREQVGGGAAVDESECGACRSQRTHRPICAALGAGDVLP